MVVNVSCICSKTILPSAINNKGRLFCNDYLYLTNITSKILTRYKIQDIFLSFCAYNYTHIRQYYGSGAYCLGEFIGAKKTPSIIIILQPAHFMGQNPSYCFYRQSCHYGYKRFCRSYIMWRVNSTNFFSEKVNIHLTIGSKEMEGLCTKS